MRSDQHTIVDANGRVGVDELENVQLGDLADEQQRLALCLIEVSGAKQYHKINII